MEKKRLEANMKNATYKQKPEKYYNSKVKLASSKWMTSSSEKYLEYPRGYSA